MEPAVRHALSTWKTWRGPGAGAPWSSIRYNREKGKEASHALAYALGAVLAAPGHLFAQGVVSPAALEMSLGNVCQVIGGAVALGFGLWHFAVPGLCGWWSCVPDPPETLVQAVDATNFFVTTLPMSD